MYGRREIDVAGLRRDLEREVTGEVRFDRGSLATYADDASNYDMRTWNALIRA
jgi:hypothetical protein